MARWDRATAWLPPDARRILDDGAAFGFGAARMRRALRARSPTIVARPLVVGVEPDPTYVARARRDQPDLALVRASADALPFAAESFDAVLLLDVLEHLPAEEPALAEAWRVLAPGGTLILSVPHRGPVTWADSLNLYVRLRQRFSGMLPLDTTERGYPFHRHYSLGELERHLGGRFSIDRVARTGLGLAELVNLALLVVCRGLLRSERLYRLLRYAYFVGYVLEDGIPAGPVGYHLTVRARRAEAG